MKKILLLLTVITLVGIAGNSYSQSYSSLVLRTYTGPKNTDELTTLLYTSKIDVLVKLDSATKNSLIKYLRFGDGMPKGMSGTDDNIQNLYKSNAAEVYSAIYGWKVKMCTFETKPVLKQISVEDFMKNYTADPIGWAFETQVSHCSNCCQWQPGGGDNGTTYCCLVGGDGCDDAITFVPNQGYFAVR